MESLFDFAFAILIMVTVMSVAWDYRKELRKWLGV